MPANKWSRVQESEWCQAGLPIIRIQNLNGSPEFNYVCRPVEARHRVTDGDLLFAWPATIGPYIWHGPEAALNQHIFKVVPNPEVVRGYLHYLLLEATRELRHAMHGSTMTHILKSQLAKLKVNLPTLSEQRRIVAEIEKQFTRLDASDALLQSANRTSQRYGSTVIRKAFTKEFPMKPLRELASIKGGLTMHADRPDLKQCSAVPYLRVANVQRGFLDLTIVKTIMATPDEVYALALQPGDIFSRKAETATS